MKRLQLVIVAMAVIFLAGCGIDTSTPAKASATTTQPAFNSLAAKYAVDGTDLSGKVICSNFFDVTVEDGLQQYDYFEYRTDQYGTSTRGELNQPFTLFFITDGPHSLVVTGYRGGQPGPPKTISFTIDSLSKIGDGRYDGDYIEYTGTYTNMSYGTARLDAVRNPNGNNPDNLTGSLTLDALVLGTDGNIGASIDNSIPPSKIELQFIGGRSLRVYTSQNSSNSTYYYFYNNSVLGSYFYRFIPGGYYHYMNLEYVDTATAAKGNLRLYRRGPSGIKKLLRAKCTNMIMKPTPVDGLPNTAGQPPQLVDSYITLYTFDDKTFYGHVRLVSTATAKVLTYDIEGIFREKLSLTSNNGIYLYLTRPMGTLTSTTPSGSTTNYGGYVTFTSENGNYKFDECSFTLNSYNVKYDAEKANIQTLESYPVTQ